MNPKQSDRRRFLKSGAALAGLVVGASASVGPLAAEPVPERIDDLHLYGERSHFVNSVRNGSINNPERRLKDEPNAFGLKYSPSGFGGDHHAGVASFRRFPRLRAARHRSPEHRLLIHGMVDRPLIFTMEELKRLPSVSRIHFVECTGTAARQVPVELPGCAECDRLRIRTDSPVAANGPECRCPCCSKRPACKKGRAGSGGRSGCE